MPCHADWLTSTTHREFTFPVIDSKVVGIDIDKDVAEYSQLLDSY